MRLVYGHGINDVDALTTRVVDGRCVRDPYYTTWRNMLYRAFSKRLHEKYPTYIGTSVCDEWLRFSNFKSWMVEQDWEGKQLDKDILQHGNKVYSPDRCLFVSQEINKLLLDSGATRGKYPQGVNWHKAVKKYRASISINNVDKSLGYYDTPEEASRVYRDAKSAYVRQIADEQDEPLRSALHRHADRIQHG